MKRYLLAVLALIVAQTAFAAPTINWKASCTLKGDALYEVVLTGAIEDGWHTYGLDDSFAPSTLEINAETKGAPQWELSETTYVIRQDVRAEAGQTITGTVEWICCRGKECSMPEYYEFSINAPAAQRTASGGLLALILEAILWGLAMLLTPCVFPMVPLTVSFFLKRSGSKAEGRFKAAMYGLFIVLLYTIPISLIIGITRVVGGDAVTADIFNWLSTHWLPNVLFFLVFLAFALSFFGLFEITLPARWSNGANSKSGAKGLGGIFFLALTLVLVSFSCTGPIVGTVLIKSVQGDFWTPMVTMLAFSIAFALPFTLLSLFPDLLGKLPKSGDWLGRVKIVLGFIELALGLKFLSTADQTYHWGILPRPLYICLWVLCFTLLTLYLLGALRFKADTSFGNGRISVLRKVLACISGAFVIYLCTGLAGAPLKALSGYLPPETQSVAPTAEVSAPITAPEALEAALAEAASQGRNVFLDITGYGCVNCREMEARVLSDAGIQKLLAENFVILQIWTDDKTRIDPSSGFKDAGRLNSDFVLKHFGVNSQPAYFILDRDGKIVAGPRAYDLDIAAFTAFLESGIVK